MFFGKFDFVVYISSGLLGLRGQAGGGGEAYYLITLLGIIIVLLPAATT